MKVCPFCAEEIQDAARVCKHCGRDLEGGASQVQIVQPKKKTSPVAFGCLVILLLGIAWCVASTSNRLDRAARVAPPAPAAAPPTVPATGAARPTSRTTGNKAHDILAGLAEGTRREAFTRTMKGTDGEACSVTSTFFQGLEKKTKSAFWNVKCRNGKAYTIQVNNDAGGSTRVVDCAVMKLVGVECFRKF